jgi:hypothetical protein
LLRSLRILGVAVGIAVGVAVGITAGAPPAAVAAAVAATAEMEAMIGARLLTGDANAGRAVTKVPLEPALMGLKAGSSKGLTMAGALRISSTVRSSMLLLFLLPSCAGIADTWITQGRRQAAIKAAIRTMFDRIEGDWKRWILYGSLKGG